jgi:Tfp pilus assembly protein FimT
MLNRINELKRNSGGFQLVELLVVVALITILLP